MLREDLQNLRSEESIRIGEQKALIAIAKSLSKLSRQARNKIGY